MTLGCETPCKLLSAVAVGMAINDTPTPDNPAFALPIWIPACCKVSTLFWDAPGAPPALFASLMAFSTEAVYLCDSPSGLTLCAGRRKEHNPEKKSQGQG